MVMPHLVERYWTADDVRALPDDGNRYECIDGALLVTPSPRWTHQRAVFRLMLRLTAFVDEHALGDLLFSPADIELEPGTLVQPDAFVAQMRAHAQPPYEWSDVASLLLAVEVLSPSTRRRDRTVKREFYQRSGVGEYWVVDVDARRVERWRAADSEPEILSETLTWAPVGAAAPLELNLPEYFAEVTGG
jgi:Uma2 family endonuclease